MSALGLAFQRPGDDQNILGWLIVFFMVVWPLIRGIVEAANERRRKFVEDQQRRAGTPTARGGRPETQADPFEALRRAMLGTPADDDEEHAPRRSRPSAGPKAPPKAPAPARRHPGPPPSVGAQGSTPRPMVGGAGPRPAPRSLEHVPPSSRQLAGDPFDERVLERPLVADPELARVPSEGGAATEPPERHGRRPPTPPTDAPSSLYPVAEGAALAARSSPSRPAAPTTGEGSRCEAAALARVARRVRSPWGRAVLYEELLGPPVALRDPRY